MVPYLFCDKKMSSESQRVEISNKFHTNIKLTLNRLCSLQYQMPSRKILNSVEFYSFFFLNWEQVPFFMTWTTNIYLFFFSYLFSPILKLWFFVLKYHSDCFLLRTSIKVLLLSKFLCKGSNSKLKLIVQDFSSK